MHGQFAINLSVRNLSSASFWERMHNMRFRLKNVSVIFGKLEVRVGLKGIGNI